MKESLDQAIEELKREEHLLYVSLKYTRTVDVLKNIIDRMINSFSYGFQALLIYAKSQGLITTYPSNLALRCQVLKEAFPKDTKLHGYIDFYLKLRKINRADYTRREEYRRHVTMTVVVEGETIEITMDSIMEDSQKLKEFIQYVREMVYGKEAADDIPDVPDYL